MLIKIHKNRSVSSSGTWGTKNENNYEILNFEFPEELEEYNKRIVYYLGNQKVWDAIIDNKAILTNAITTKGSVKAYVWCTKSDEAFETDVDFRTQIFVMNFFENDNADGIVPTPEQVDGFNTMLTAMNEKIEEINELETTIENAETTRQEHEETRQENESTRQENEQTRQNQEAERERRTDEAISNIQDKTAEYNQNAEAKTNEFNQNATQKTNDFNANYTQKVNDFNSNASSKTSAFNSNAETKTNAFNTNATNKTNAFNSNASTKTSEFNTNAESKTTAFNDNATQKTTNFDNNASEKTDEFNTNAQEKIDEYDEHIVEYQEQIDELQEEVEELSENMPWDTTEQATEISVNDAAKYSRNKLELFGNTEQASTTGKNLFNKNGQVTLGARLGGNGTAYSADASDYYISEWIRIQPNITYTKNSPMADAYHRVCFYTNNNSDSFISYSENNTFTTPATSVYLRFCGLKTEIDTAQIEEGSTATNYEPYTGGQPSPNPDYPQDIHVVSGNNTIKENSANYCNNSMTKSWNTNGNVTYSKDSDGVITFKSNASNQNAGIYKPSAWLGNNFSDLFNKYSSVTVSCEIKSDVAQQVTVLKNQRVNTTTQWQRFSSTYTSSGAIVFYDYSKTMQNIYIRNIQIEPGNTMTSYVPYYHQDYPINLGSLELCKIGDYQDESFKNEPNNPHYDSSLVKNGWYKNKKIEKLVIDSDSNLNRSGFGTNSYLLTLPSNYVKADGQKVMVISNKFVGIPYNNRTQEIPNSVFEAASRNIIFFRNTIFPTLEDFKNGNIGTIVYYVLEDAINIPITDTTLISQLDAIYEHLKLVKGTNNITVTAEDLAPNMQLSYMQDLKSKLDNLDSRLSLLE